MDPQTAWDDLLEAIAGRNRDRVEELAEGLLTWLSRNGFLQVVRGTRNRAGAGRTDRGRDVRRAPDPRRSFKVAGFQAPLAGWFWAPLAVSASNHPKDPPLSFGDFSIPSRQCRIRINVSQCPSPAHFFQPTGDGIGVVLIDRAVSSRVTPPQDGWERLGNDRPAPGDLPAIKRPEVNLLSNGFPNSIQPGNACMSGLGHLPLHVELEVALRGGSPSFRHP